MANPDLEYRAVKIGDTIYLDHQATTPVDNRVREAMEPYHTEEFGNPHSTDHAIGWEAAKVVEDSAGKVGKMLSADLDEIIFTSGATEANNLALLGLSLGTNDTKRKRVLVSAVEHKSVLATARVLQERFSFSVETIPVDSNGVVSLSAFEAAINDSVLLASIMLVNNEIGSIQPIKQIYGICEKHGVLLHCDAAQAPSAVSLSGINEFTDLLSISAHKIYGPKGIGALFAHRHLHQQIEPIIHGGGQQGHLRSGTLPTALCVGMGVAADIVIEIEQKASPNQTGESITEDIRPLRDEFANSLMSMNWQVKLNGPPLSERHPGNANMCFEGFSAQDTLALLQPKLAASTGSACTTGIPEPSHVLNAIGLSDEEANASIRFSLGRNTTKEDITESVRLIDETLTKLADK